MGINPWGAESLLITLLASLAILRPTLTRPGFANFQVLFAGWIQTTGLHAVTETLVVTDVARRRHHEVHVVRIVAEPIGAHRRVGIARYFSSTATAVLLSFSASR